MAAKKRKVGSDRPENRGNAGKGRKKGVPNKATASVKAALVEAFEKRGGVPALLAWANTEPTEFYKLWVRMLPQDVDLRVTDIGEQLRLARERVAKDSA